MQSSKASRMIHSMNNRTPLPPHYQCRSINDRDGRGAQRPRSPGPSQRDRIHHKHLPRPPVNRLVGRLFQFYSVQQKYTIIISNIDPQGLITLTPSIHRNNNALIDILKGNREADIRERHSPSKGTFLNFHIRSPIRHFNKIQNHE